MSKLARVQNSKATVKFTSTSKLLVAPVDKLELPVSLRHIILSIHLVQEIGYSIVIFQFTPKYTVFMALYAKGPSECD